MAEVVGRLNAMPGARHVSLTTAGHDAAAVIIADLRPSAADPALEMLRGLWISPDDVALVRLDTIGAEHAHGEPLALVHADLLGHAR